MTDGQFIYRHKKPQPKQDDHACAMYTRFITEKRPKVGHPYRIYQCEWCGEIWEEEAETCSGEKSASQQ